ncbi:MAG: hypothetical protein KAS12_05900, partial [Candidatus Aenigmarchaeota archaeon]|nr:hypothetical protein [Candidatus Aenigmarchaeota archaeon]
PLIVDVLLSLGYKVFDNDEDRNDISGSLKLTDFLVSDIGRIIYAENRGSELQITVDSENLGYWTVEVKGLSSKEKEAEKLVDTIKTKICAEVKLKDGSSPMHMGLLAEYKKALLK